jgi:hypothetical protein
MAQTEEGRGQMKGFRYYIWVSIASIGFCQAIFLAAEEMGWLALTSACVFVFAVYQAWKEW